jgi:hypothetical protein
MDLRAAAAVLLVVALPAGRCLRAHDTKALAARSEEPPAAAEPAPSAPVVVVTPPAAPPLAASVDFETGVRPLLEARCQPCHFAGGKMYEKLPFDRPETIHHLGERLFTRIKAPEDQALLRAFLAQREPDAAEP